MNTQKGTGIVEEITNKKGDSQMENERKNESKIEILHQALDLIQEAQCLVDGVMEDSYNKSHYESYGKYGFDQLLGNGNPYDSSIYTVIEDLEKEEVK
jgi:hypothetical protein